MKLEFDAIGRGMQPRERVVQEKQPEPRTGAETDGTEHQKLPRRKWIAGLVLLAVVLAAPVTWLAYCRHTENQLKSLEEHPGFQKGPCFPVWLRRFANRLNLPVPKRITGFRGPHATNEDMRFVTRVRSLQTLLLDGSAVTDAGLTHLPKLRTLHTLSLCDTNVTDDGLASLSGLVKLSHLGLSNTQVTDKGVRHLKPLKQLKTLLLRGTHVTPEGEALLKAVIPGVKIISDH